MAGAFLVSEPSACVHSGAVPAGAAAGDKRASLWGGSGGEWWSASDLSDLELPFLYLHLCSPGSDVRTE